MYISVAALVVIVRFRSCYHNASSFPPFPPKKDLASAERLAAELQEHLKEEEIYRVDHYMGKAAVQAILPFRHANRDWLEKVWNAEHLERVEIAMKETEDCEGRTAFYEVGKRVGVVGRGNLSAW